MPYVVPFGLPANTAAGKNPEPGPEVSSDDVQGKPDYMERLPPWYQRLEENSGKLFWKRA